MMAAGKKALSMHDSHGFKDLSSEEDLDIDDVHPERMRLDRFANIEPMQVVERPTEIIEILSKKNVRLHVDTRHRFFDAQKLKKQVGNLNKISDTGRLETVYEFMEDNFSNIDYTQMNLN